MRRRTLIAAIGAAAVCAPPFRPARPQAMPVIGYLSSKDPAAEASVLGPMRDSLAKAGFVEGPNLAIEYRWSEGHYDRLPLQASDLVARKVRLIVTSGFPATLAAKAATSTIPIVFRLAVDPVATKLAASLSRPGGNLTGVTMLFDALTPKKIELLRELVPQGRQIAFLINPRNRNASSHRQHAERASEALGLQLTVVTAGENGEIGPAFDLARQHGAAAILVGDDPFFDVKKAALVDAAGRSRIPTMFYVRDFVEGGGLISYGPSFDEMATLVGKYAARILKGADPAGIPISQPTKIELIINLKAAKTLGLAVPQSLLARADEVIE